MDFRDTWPDAAEIIDEIERTKREAKLKDERIKKMSDLIHKQREIIRLLKERDGTDVVSEDFIEFLKAAYGDFDA